MRVILVVVPLVVIAIFAMLNWTAFTAPVTLTLGWGSFRAPLGLLMLMLLAAVTLFFLVYMALWQARMLAETRQHARELAAQRALADQAEASRFTELRKDIEQSANSLAAMIGEIDDRLRRGGDDPSA